MLSLPPVKKHRDARDLMLRPILLLPLSGILMYAGNASNIAPNIVLYTGGLASGCKKNEEGPPQFASKFPMVVIF